MLSIYKTFIELQNKNGFFDINKTCETIFCEVLNALYQINLTNLNNILESNYPAIDLGDEYSEICYQITSRNDVEKIKYTISKFQQKKLDEKFTELNIFILGQKKSYRVQFPNYVNVVDFVDLSRDIANCRQKDTLIKIHSILNDEFINLGIIHSQQNMLDNIERAEIIFGKTYSKFFGFLGLKEEIEFRSTANDIHRFANQLQKLHSSHRQVIYAVVLNQLSTKMHFHLINLIRFNPNLVGTLLNNQSQVNNILKQLYDLGYCSVDDEDINTAYLQFFNETKDYCLLETIDSYCKKENIDVGPLLLNLDFTILD